MVLYSYVILCDFFPINFKEGVYETHLGLAISIPEIVLIFWVATYALEEMRQVIYPLKTRFLPDLPIPV